jgi:hypothetical protein
MSAGRLTQGRPAMAVVTNGAAGLTAAEAEVLMRVDP